MRLMTLGTRPAACEPVRISEPRL